jgi:hypothetical protein
MKRKISISLAIISMVFITGCYPGGPDYVEEMDVVLTTHNKDYNFAAKATYSLPDKIVKITGNVVEGEEPSFIPDAAAKLILDRIEMNMTAFGWQKVDVSANPDILLEPASWETTTVYYWYDYWYWWYGGYYPYWPYYPPVSYTSYTTGTLLMVLIDPDQVGASGNPVTQWTGSVNGIMTGSLDATRLNTAIDKAFAISPYLKTN